MPFAFATPPTHTTTHRRGVRPTTNTTTSFEPKYYPQQQHLQVTTTSADHCDTAIETDSYYHPSERRQRGRYLSGPAVRHPVSEYSLPVLKKVPQTNGTIQYYDHPQQQALTLYNPYHYPQQQHPPIYLSSITKITTTTTTTATRRPSPLSPPAGGAGRDRDSSLPPGRTTTTTTATTTTSSSAATRPPSRLAAGAGRSSPRVSPSPSSPSHGGGRGTGAAYRSSSPPPAPPTTQPIVTQRSGSTTYLDTRSALSQPQPPLPSNIFQADEGGEEDEDEGGASGAAPGPYRQIDSDGEDAPDLAPIGPQASHPSGGSSYIQTHIQQRTNSGSAARPGGPSGPGGHSRSRSPSASRAISIRTTTGFDHHPRGMNVFDSGNDVLFSVGDKEIRANKLILAEKSPIFREMLVDCLLISDVDPEAFETMLSFMYGDEIIVSDELLAPCLAVADKYQVEGFTEALLDHFIDKVNSRNCLPLLRGGSRLKDPDEYLERVLSHVERATDEVVRQEEWTELPRDILALILSRDHLRLSELELFQATLEWARCECDRTGLSPSSGDNLRAVLGECLALLRFPVMSHAAFTDFVLPELILNPAEINDVTQWFNKDIPSDAYSMVPRGEGRTPEYYAVYRTSALQDNYAYYTPRRVILNTTLKVDRKIQVLGFDFPQNFAKRRSFLSLYITPKDARGRSKWNLETGPIPSDQSSSSAGVSGGRALVTGYKLLLEENTEYTFKITCDLSPGEGFYAPSAPAFEPETVLVDVTSGRMAVDFLDEATLTLSIARQNLTMAIPSILMKPRYY